MYIYPDNLKSKAVLWLWEPWPNLASCPQW